MSEPGTESPSAAPTSGSGAHAQPRYSPPVYGQPSPYGQQSYGQQQYPASPYSESAYADFAPPFMPVPVRFYYDVELTGDQLNQCETAVDRVLQRELAALATKLAVANERLFDQYDRLSAEASLRLNAALPLALLFGVLAARLSWFFLFGIPAAVLLAWQGLVRMRSANDLLMQSVITKTVESSEVAGIVRYVIREQHGHREQG
ncbi:MAG: hypothetical protein QOJ50_530 [Cryptosporangiaceae bacterium]|nr:hypothetical protein [Cryptosporangiaceae bacterium]